ncbi:conserved hypothetical protein [Ricinus communis]|uniref:Uncharacterized protein n=1 Tax=Ricinus communis TaxID=3988 RepID=B9RJM3_RICCO|nr:conserved hypothetical protein [Ricinus communis]
MGFAIFELLLGKKERKNKPGSAILIQIKESPYPVAGANVYVPLSRQISLKRRA